jgi:hypothetical protein
MATPKGQKIIVLDINAGTEAFIQNALNNGYAIWSITSLSPVFSKLIIIYAEPPDAPAPV